MRNCRAAARTVPRSAALSGRRHTSTFSNALSSPGGAPGRATVMAADGQKVLQIEARLRAGTGAPATAQLALAGAVLRCCPAAHCARMGC